MFARQRAAREQARRDAEWRSLVRAIADPHHLVSEHDETRFRAHLGGLAGTEQLSPSEELARACRARISGPSVPRPGQAGMWAPDADGPPAR